MSENENLAEKPSTIRLLSSEVVDQIAAGEVVERPAHLVKELVENALDAGATSIEVEYDQGGRRVRVTDNGKGISSVDLSLALARHATSKIVKADDLWSLRSFGFRGEALSSIASVSRLTLQSRPKTQESAFKVLSDFGKLSSVEPTGGNPGTTILIEELFGNVPARLKFLKSESAESAQIKAALKALALANEGVEFRLRTKGKLEHVWAKTESFLERARQIMGAEKLFETSYEYDGYRSQIVFAGPHEVAGNSRSILVFVQDRWVQDRGLQAAVIEAYRGLLMHGEFPIATVRLHAPLEHVDVNIHPTKSQVKFRDPQSAFRAVNRALREAIEKAPWLTKGSEQRSSQAPALSESGASVKKLSVADLTRPYQQAVSLKDLQDAALARASTEAGEASDDSFLSLETAPVHSVGRFEAPEFNTIVFKQKQDVGGNTELTQDTPNVGGAWSRLQVLGQANLTYIVAQDDDRIVLVDQHAAHERVAYERLMRSWKEGEAEVQSLLLPLTVELEADGAEALLAVSEELEMLGVYIDQIGPNAVAVRARPAIISDSAISRALNELSQEILEKGGSFALEKKISDLCATMACHSVVRAGQALSIDQMKSLLVQMDEFPLSSFCPHGRPVSVDYPFARLERDFGRIV